MRTAPSVYTLELRNTRILILLVERISLAPPPRLDGPSCDDDTDRICFRIEIRILSRRIVRVPILARMRVNVYDGSTTIADAYDKLHVFELIRGCTCARPLRSDIETVSVRENEKRLF